MSEKLMEYLKDYVPHSIDLNLGIGFFNRLAKEQQTNITRYVEVNLYNKLKSIGAAPPLIGESQTCENLLEKLEDLQEVSQEEFQWLINGAVGDYIKNAQRQNKKIGVFIGLPAKKREDGGVRRAIAE